MSSLLNRARSQSPRPQVSKTISYSGREYLSYLEERRKAFEAERASLSIYTSPLKVVGYFFLYAFSQFYLVASWLFQRYFLALGLIIFALILSIIFRCQGPHQEILLVLKGELSFYGYWLALGVASSIGLGTGLHTFVLFLGPHVAEITMAAYECGSLDFSVRGANRLMCPFTDQTSLVTPLMILLKVLPQSIIWGFGTALGELPPYFIARAAAQTGKGSEEMEQLDSLNKESPGSLTLRQQVTLTIYRLLLQTGFLGILACASIPNPLFDLAGITCGHFLIPFTTFFSAVVIGKAFIKSTLQVLMIILIFSREAITVFLGFIKSRAPFLHAPLEKMVQDQIRTIRASHLPTQKIASGTKLIPLLWNSLIALMMLYFLFSIIESLAQTYLQQYQESELFQIEQRQRKRSRSM